MLNGRCDQARLTDAMRVLLGHFYQPNETPQMRAMLIADFVRDLADMSDEAVAWAIREWRRTQDRRPSPAALRQLCMMRRHEATQALQARSATSKDTAPPMWTPATPEELAARKIAFKRIAKDSGFVEVAGQLAFPGDAKNPPRIPHWSETAAPDDPRWAEVRRARQAAGVTA